MLAWFRCIGSTKWNSNIIELRWDVFQNNVDLRLIWRHGLGLHMWKSFLVYLISTHFEQLCNAIHHRQPQLKPLCCAGYTWFTLYFNAQFSKLSWDMLTLGLGTLGKSLWTVWRSCWWLGLCPSPVFYSPPWVLVDCSWTISILPPLTMHLVVHMPEITHLNKLLI